MQTRAPDDWYDYLTFMARYDNSGPKTSEGHFWPHYNYIKFIMIENLSSTLMWQKYKRNHAQPRERFELSTPGLQDQCSNHWANEATTKMALESINDMSLLARGFFIFYFLRLPKCFNLLMPEDN